MLVALLLAPSGYAIQDVVADAMTVEAVPKVDQRGLPFTPEETRAQHTTMQTLGRVSIISGFRGGCGCKHLDILWDRRTAKIRTPCALWPSIPDSSGHTGVVRQWSGSS